jgi:hypothetical protein
MRMAISACCLAAFLFFGFDQGVFSGILQNKDWLDQFGHPVRPCSSLFLALFLHFKTENEALARWVSYA